MSWKEKIEPLLATSEPPDLGAGPRPGVQSEAALNRALDEAMPGKRSDAQQLARALVLLWHDHLDAAHRIAQEDESADGAFVHGLMHRREGDFSNAKYWFRRVGNHPTFAEIARQCESLPEAKAAPGIIHKLISGGKWDPYAMVDCCQEACRSSASDARRLLREIQRIETRVLLNHFDE